MGVDSCGVVYALKDFNTRSASMPAARASSAGSANGELATVVGLDMY